MLIANIYIQNPIFVKCIQSNYYSKQLSSFDTSPTDGPNQKQSIRDMNNFKRDFILEIAVIIRPQVFQFVENTFKEIDPVQFLQAYIKAGIKHANMLFTHVSMKPKISIKLIYAGLLASLNYKNSTDQVMHNRGGVYYTNQITGQKVKMSPDLTIFITNDMADYGTGPVCHSATTYMSIHSSPSYMADAIATPLGLISRHPFNYDNPVRYDFELIVKLTMTDRLLISVCSTLSHKLL